MTEDTKSDLIAVAVVAIMVILIMFMMFLICERDVRAESIETLVNEYPFWAVSPAGDSTFQTVQIVKCRRRFPNGQVERLGYKVAVDSSGCRIYEENLVWFLRWAIWDALRLQVSLGKS